MSAQPTWWALALVVAEARHDNALLSTNVVLRLVIDLNGRPPLVDDFVCVCVFREVVAGKGENVLNRIVV